MNGAWRVTALILHQFTGRYYFLKLSVGCYPLIVQTHEMFIFFNLYYKRYLM